MIIAAFKTNCVGSNNSSLPNCAATNFQYLLSLDSNVPLGTELICSQIDSPRSQDSNQEPLQ